MFKKILICVCLLTCVIAVQRKAFADPVRMTGLQQSVSGWVRNFTPFAYQQEAAKGFVYEPLFIYNGMNNEEIPWLAEKAELQDDLKTIILTVRKGVKWNDGEDFNADDVAFSYIYPKEHPEIDYGGMWGDGGKLESVRKIDDYTVEFIMKEQNAFGNTALFNEYWIVAEHDWKDVREPATRQVDKPVGTGPLTEIVRFSPQLFVQGRNPYYWQADKLSVDEFYWPQFNSNDAAYDLLMSGSVDWAQIFIPEIDTIYVDGSEYKKYWFPPSEGTRVAMNMQTKNKDNLKAFENIHFRRAFSLAMNRKDMIEIGAYGYVVGGNPATGLSPSLWGWRNHEADEIWAEYYKFDLEKAKKELTEGGFKDIDHDGYFENPDGSKIAFDIQVPSGWTDWVNNTQIAVEGLRKIGIMANVKTPEVNAYVENWTTGNFDAQFCGNSLMPSIYKFYDHTMSEAYFYTNAWWSSNETKYINSERDALIEKLKLTVEEDDQRKITDQIEMMYAKNIPHIPLYYNGKWHEYNTKRFSGWATEKNPFISPALADYDNRIIHLLNLKPVK